MAVAAELPLIVMELVEPRLTVGRSTAPAGLEEIAAVSVTVPVNPPVGVIEIVEVFPEVAPGATVTGFPEMLNPLTVNEKGADGEVTPLLALIVRLNTPPETALVASMLKAIGNNPPGRSAALDCAKLHVAPLGKPEHANWLNSPE